MKKVGILSLLLALLMLVSVLFITPTTALDQPSSRLSEITIPSDIQITEIAWNENTYSYAIGVGVNISTNKAVICRYEPESGWKVIYEDSGTGLVYYDIIYDAYTNNDTFLIVGDDSQESEAYVIYDADTDSPNIVDLGAPPPGGGYLGACFDRYTGPEGTLVAVGTPYASSGGIIAWHDMSKDGDIWSKFVLKTGIILKAVTTNQDPLSPLAIGVGYDDNTGKAVAYVTDYNNVYGLNVPPDAAEFDGIRWKPEDAGGYALVAGKDLSGHGRVWKLDDIHQTFHISYYNRTAGYESLKYAFYNGYNWRIATVDTSQYAGYYSSIALDSHGNPHISYWDGGTTYLKHAYMEGGHWYTETVDASGNVGQYSSIAIDSEDIIHISYFDNTNSHLKYAYYDGIWQIETVDTSSQVGWDTSIAVDSYNNPHISYYDYNNGDLKYAWKSGGAWQNETVDSLYDVGRYSSIAIDSQNDPHISYLDSGAGGLKYAYKNSGSWSIETALSGVLGQYTSLALDKGYNPYISYIDSGLKYTEKTSGSWSSSTLIDSNADSYTSLKLGLGGTPYICYYDSNADDLKFAWYDSGANMWNTMVVDSYGDVGDYSSLAIGMGGHYTPVKISDNAGVLRDIGWKNDGSLAVIVGDGGAIFLYYNGTNYAYNWSDPSILFDFTGVAVKPPGSAGYAVAVGPTGVTKISYQVYNTDTEIRARAIEPNLNEVNITDSSGNCLLNHQIDVQSQITFFINASYESGWDQVGGIDIYAWYDFGNEATQYNDTKGANINFHLHYTPDYVNIDQGTWELLWPNSGEVSLIDWYQTFEDNKNFVGTPGVLDPTDYFLLYVNISFGPQVRYADGGGGFPPIANTSANQSDQAASFDNKFSWNFNVTIYDKINIGTNDVKYDEFGVYAYTEITVTNNPSGTGAPGETIELSPYSHLGVRSNRNYTVNVSIGDLENATGARKITRDYVEVRNPSANNDTSISDIAYWLSFPASGPLTVWGAGGGLVEPLDFGTCSVGTQPGYDIDVDYTTIMWRITIPPSTPEDEYSSVITFEITYW